jgi:shikimate kinase
MNIILIGYRCTGKTSVGCELSERLKMPFYDTDIVIEKNTGKSIHQMVSEKGWAFFREREKEVIRQLAACQNIVIATGGGAIMDEGNAVDLKKNGLLVWLIADEKTIIERIRRDPLSQQRRPSLLNDDLVSETRRTLTLRTPLYRRWADFSVNTNSLGIKEIADGICQFWAKNVNNA